MTDNLLHNKIKNTFSLNKSYENFKKNSRDVIEENESRIKKTETIEANIQIKNQNLETVEESLDSLNFLTDSFDNGEKSEKLSSLKEYLNILENDLQTLEASFLSHSHFLADSKTFNTTSIEVEKSESYESENNVENNRSKSKTSVEMFAHINSLKCNECDFTCTENSVLSKHMINEHTSFYYDFKCDECNFKCARKAVLTRHTIDEHSLKEILKCSMCKYQTRVKSFYNNHILIHSNDIFSVYKCDLCHYKTDKLSDYRRHHTAKHIEKSQIYHSEAVQDSSDKVFRCEECNYLTIRKSDMQRHVRSRHTKNMPCQNDNMILDQTEDGVENTDKTNDEIENSCKRFKCDKIFRCEECSYLTIRKSDMQRHVRSKHTKNMPCQNDNMILDQTEDGVGNTDKTNDEIENSCKRFTEDKSNSKRYVCDCTYSTDRLSDFRRHCTAKYLSGPRLKCELCEYETECTLALKKHTSSALIHPDEHFFSKCAKCSYQCISQANLKEHTQIYHDNGNFNCCSKCNFKSFSLSKLKKHMALNSHYGRSELDDSTQFDCKTCGYICKSASNFSNHLKMHNIVKDRKLYICNQCSYSTHRKHDLKRHMTRIHKATFEEVWKALLNDQESRSEEIYIKEDPIEIENREKEIGEPINFLVEKETGEMKDEIREKGSEIIYEEGV